MSKYCTDTSKILEAYSRISSKINKTPVLTSNPYENAIATGSMETYFKCENLQKTGSFKYRGALNAVSNLKTKNVAAVVTHSSGNHGQALALAAKTENIPAYVVMPENSPNCKIEAVLSHGAEVIFCEPKDSERTRLANEAVEKYSGVLVHPNQDPDVISGQGTIAVELMDQFREIGNLDAIFVPVGGGGMISGIAMFAKTAFPGVKVIGLEPDLADDCFRSLKAGKIVPNETYPKTCADGVRTNIGENAWPIIRDFVDEVITFSEQEIINGWLLGMQSLKTVLEPTAGLGIAAATNEKIQQKFAGKRVCVILCGSNCDFHQAKKFIN